MPAQATGKQRRTPVGPVLSPAIVYYCQGGFATNEVLPTTRIVILSVNGEEQVAASASPVVPFSGLASAPPSRLQRLQWESGAYSERRTLFVFFPMVPLAAALICAHDFSVGLPPPRGSCRRCCRCLMPVPVPYAFGAPFGHWRLLYQVPQRLGLISVAYPFYLQDKSVGG